MKRIVVALFGALVMALLNVPAAGGGRPGAPEKPRGLKTEAPSSNPLDREMDDLWHKYQAGEITLEEAAEMYGDSFDGADDDTVRQHNGTVERLYRDEYGNDLIRKPKGDD